MEAGAAPFTSPLAEDLAPDLLDRFQRYVRVNTQAARERTGSPSTPGQLDLSRMLVDELLRIGLDDASLDENGYVMATLPSRVGPDAPVIGLIAHVDTSPDAPGDGVEPIVHRGYDGGVIELPRGGTVLDPASMRHLGEMAGHDIVTSSGDTLLGADDKAGVAEIMAALSYLADRPGARAADAAGLLHPRRGGGRGRAAVRHRAVRRRVARTRSTARAGASSRTRRSPAKEATVTIHGVDVHPGFGTGSW